MFKKLKDKLAEEVKSSPQRIQQFAQAAQAAVSSASSSISDITNSDLFSIGDNDGQAGKPIKPSTSSSQTSTFQDISLLQPTSAIGSETSDYLSAQDIMEHQRQRRLSNSSMASDVSFRLPSYESPSMYHLQSDMEVSASEAEERGFASGAVSLDRVTKEQLYAAYRRTQDRYSKYRTQYADLARHYKLLERENAKARSVLVETQDKALRRISELREQCSLEQSAKAHLEKALRVEIDEKNMKIEALSTKVSLLQNNFQSSNEQDKPESIKKEHPDKENEVQLINLAPENDYKPSSEESSTNEAALHSKIEKMEQLLNKYKESIKTVKDKNSQMTAELQILSSELENKKKENLVLQGNIVQLSEAQLKIQDLNSIIEELQNKINTYDFNKSKEMLTLENDLQKSQEEITQLQSKIDVFSKREEEYAISLAENKLSIHKELEGKESEIKTLKDSLSSAKKELQSLNIILSDYKNNITSLEEERSKLSKEINELNNNKSKINEMETQIQTLTQKCQSFEQTKTKDVEELKCLQLQMKQETAEKLAMVDRNTYLENRISQLTEENSKKSSQITQLEKDLLLLSNKEQNSTEMLTEIEFWKSKCSCLENEIQEEREELIKLQTEIEKLLANHEAVQNQNIELNRNVSSFKSENVHLLHKVDIIKNKSQQLNNELKSLRSDMKSIVEFAKLFKKEFNDELLPEIISKVDILHKLDNNDKYDQLQSKCIKLETELKAAIEDHSKKSDELGILTNKNKQLDEKLQISESKIYNLDQEIKSVTEKLEHSTNVTNLLKSEKEKLLIRLQEIETLYKHLQDNVDHDKSQYLTALDKLRLLEDEKQTLQKKLSNIEKENECLNIDIEKLKVMHNDDTVRLNSINKENQTINDSLEEKQLAIQKLSETMELISQENITLKKQSENIANNFKALEQEIDEVRRSHSEIETEKDRLNSIIDILEKKEQERAILNSNDKTLSDSQVQTENMEDEVVKKSISTVENVYHNDDILAILENVDVLTTKNSAYAEEIKMLKETNISLSNELKEFKQSATNDNLKDIDSKESPTISKDYDLLKEENRRLQSDIEGLQTYLSKISKENGSLNDKLRELIATSESSTGKDVIVGNTTDNDKLDLIRENALLLEENLELKDQLQSQHYNAPKNNLNNNDKDTVPLEKYNNLLMNKNKLEDKLLDLEQTSRNMQHIQTNNEKLKLNNEKLERRLDEALVSLRHLHSLQENTELEYLRNILYEYLTGSGTHSATLAKVLAAVVKFDDKQTQHVMQKEKERQGLLRQLGLL